MIITDEKEIHLKNIQRFTSVFFCVIVNLPFVSLTIYGSLKIKVIY